MKPCIFIRPVVCPSGVPWYWGVVGDSLRLILNSRKLWYLFFNFGKVESAAQPLNYDLAGHGTSYELMISLH